MKKIIAITLGGKEIPSSNFRFRQYYDLLKQNGYIIEEVNSMLILNPKLPRGIGLNAIINKIGLKKVFINLKLKKFKKSVSEADIIWVNKLLLPQLYEIVKQSGKKIITDVDDAMWISNPQEFSDTIKITKTVIAGNEYLAQNINENFNGKTFIIPTSIDLKKYPKTQKNSEKFKIVWIGSHSTNEYLQLIKKPLNEFLQNTNSEFHIISTKLNTMRKDFPNHTFFHEWQAETYIEKLVNSNIGIMPLPDSEWSKGKCSFKMLQYMSAHLPVIVSPIGMNKQILDEVQCGIGATDDKEWKIALEYFYKNDEIAKEYGTRGYNLIKKKYSKEANFNKLVEALLS